MAAQENEANYRHLVIRHYPAITNSIHILKTLMTYQLKSTWKWSQMIKTMLPMTMQVQYCLKICGLAVSISDLID